jgi:hypothetical protein
MEHSRNERHEILYYNTHITTPLRCNRYPKEMVEAPPFGLGNLQFDAIILDYSFLSARNGHARMFEPWRRNFGWFKKFDCPIIAIPQDVGMGHGYLDDWLEELGVSAVFTTLDHPDLFQKTRKIASIQKCLPGYVDERVAQEYYHFLFPHQRRHLDIVYRARKLPLQFGVAGHWKTKIAELIKPMAHNVGLRTSIEVGNKCTIYGTSWLDFLASSRMTLGTEGGYSTVDKYGELRTACEMLEAQHPQKTFHDLARLMPAGWDEYKLFTATPRHLEAAMTLTTQILLEGNYCGLFEEGRNCIMLAKDLSNLAEITYVASHPDVVEKMAVQAFKDVIMSGTYSYSKFAHMIEDAIQRAT